MSISMYSASVPVFVRNLNNLLDWLDKAQAHAEAKKFDAAVYLGLRLAPDMLPFSKQIQIASDAAKGCVARLAGVEIPKWDDTEVSLDDLRARIRKTLDYVQSLPASQFEGSEAREIVLPMRSGDVLKFSGQHFLEHWALPNFYFHVMTTYALLRNGAATAVTAAAYVPGQAIEFDGMSLTVTGTPASGDRFDATPSARDLSLFDTLDQVADELAVSGRSAAQVTQTVQRALRDVDTTLGTLISVRSQLGEVLGRTDAVEERLAESKLAAQTERSAAEDLDMISAVSDFQNRQTSYDAALKAYSMVQRLSLFQYIS